MKIAFILIADNLECDDRIRKEMLSIKYLIGDVSFKIFAFSGVDNHSGNGVLSYGVPYEFIPVRFRESRKKDIFSMILKEYSFFSQVSSRVKDFDLLWCIDEQPFFFPLFSHKRIIWDLHEIPHPLIGTKFKNLLFRYMERRCKWLVHANYERMNYLCKEGAIKIRNKNLVLRNFPDNNWLSKGDKKSVSFELFEKWLNGSDYIYLQGINSESRFAWETLCTIMEVHRMKAVVIGKVPQNIKDNIASKYVDFDKYIYYTGQLNQDETAAFIHNSMFSIVFYIASGIANDRFCEPNRLFQCLGMGKPVITGCNESMRNIVSCYGNGISISTDGSVIEDNIKAVNEMISNYEKYRLKAEKYRDLFIWETQHKVFDVLFDYMSRN